MNLSKSVVVKCLSSTLTLKMENEFEFETFKKRPGTTDKGKEYEDVVLAKVVLELVNDPAITNFHVASNQELFGAFDDIVIKTESDEEKKALIKAVQLKHAEKKTLSTENLRSRNGDFSLSRYFESFKKIKEQADEFILFTNRSFKCKDKAKFQLEEERFYVELVKAKPSSELSVQKDCVYQFQIAEDPSIKENDPKVQEYKEFFSKFYLYTGQERLEELKNTTAEKFATTYSSSDDTFDTFLRTISAWSIQDGKKEKLNKTWIKRLIALLLLSPHVEPLSFDSVNDKMEIFREAISSFCITLFEEKSCQIVKQLWGDVGNEKNIDFKELNKARKRYLPTVKHIDNKNMDPKIVSQLLWLTDKCPLILRECENIEKVIQLCPNKKFILVGKNESEEWMTKYSSFQNLSDLTLKPDLCEKLIQNFSISIQGKEELDLLTAFGSDEEFLENVTTDDLAEMLTGPHRIGGEKEALPDPYIERYVSRNIINITYLEKLHENTIIILNCENNFDKVTSKLSNCKLIDINNFLQNKNRNFDNLTNNEVLDLKSNPGKYIKGANRPSVAKAMYAGKNQVQFESKLNNKANEFSFDKSKFANTVYVGNRHCNDHELEEIYHENKETKHFHYFKLLSDGNLEWIKSKGDVSGLENYKLFEKYSMNENALWSSRLVNNNNINLITGDPGLGKSELMKSLKNKCPREYWTVIITPQFINSFFHNSEYSKTTNCRELFEKLLIDVKCQLVNKSDQKFFEIFIKKNKVVYVWDALDEILRENLDAILNIILHLSTEGVHQWVTSRRDLKILLQNKFSLLSFSINQFSENEQQHYFRKRLNTFISADTIEVTIDKIKSSFAVVEHVDILGIPLQIFMLTELFRQNNEKYIKLMDNTFLLTDLYDYFISEKFNIFYDKMKIDLQNPHLASRIHEEKRKVLDTYERVALKVVFHDEILQQLNINFEKHIKKFVKKYASLGLVKELQNEVPLFLHGSFAEYLVATYFYKNNGQSKDVIANILFDGKYNNVRFFFDMLLSKNSKAHIAVLYKNYELLKTYDDEILTRKDECGRSALHLISSWGKRHPRVNITAAYLVHENPNFDKKSESGAYIEAVTFLQLKNDADECDTLLNATPLSYARKSESLGAELKLLQTKKNELSQLCVHDDMVYIFYYSALLGYDDVCTLFTAEILEKCGVHRITAISDEMPLLKKGSLDEYQRKLFVQFECSDTLLYIASHNGHEKIVEYLTTLGAEIHRANFCGWTPLHVASLNGHEKVVQHLTTVGAEINDASNGGWILQYAASQNGHEKVVEYLATVGAEINHAVKDGWTPLHLASFNGHEKVVEYLATVGAEINCADNEGWTPLHIASQNGHQKVVEYLATVGAEINHAVNDGVTPLHLASFNGHQKVVEYLATVGAEINRAMNEGVTPLYAASFNGHEKVVEYLATVGAEINRGMNDGRTPLFTASQSGHEKVVKYLATIGAEINRADNYGWTPLYVASFNGHEKVVEYLATVGAEINRTTKNGWTPLHVASLNGHGKVVEHLATVGAEINLAANDGCTPLHAASHNGHKKVVEYLTTVGAEINRTAKNGSTPLGIASLNGHEKLVEYFAAIGGEINCANNNGVTPLLVASNNGHEKVVKCLVTVGADINQVANCGYGPLHMASFNGHKKVVEYLVTVGAEINRATNDGWTPLYIASRNGHQEVVEYLATVGAEINRADTDGWTPLYVASQNGHEKVVECLTTLGADINRAADGGYTQSGGGYTPLYIASINGHEKVVECLTIAGADINLADTDGFTPLHTASQNGHQKVIEYLVTHGAEINCARKDGWTPLHVASCEGHEKVVEYLATVGAEINRVQNETWTALHIACKHGHLKVVEHLSAAGAEINRADDVGLTPLSIASLNGHEKVVEYLATVGAEVNCAAIGGCIPLHFIFRLLRIFRMLRILRTFRTFRI
ncbi:uncharacterized protein LOC135123265 [Zophobas morio]|uniref:uncharacterized protein LOC135123265 n=1 Tax=Zophobas morio TaxID=2755281 RepID=UPI0030839F35